MKVYLIAGSKSPETQSVRFSGSALSGRRAKVLFEEHSVAVEGEVLAGPLTGFGVHRYELE